VRVLAFGDALFASRDLRRRIDPGLLGILSGFDCVFANAEFSCPAASTPPTPRRFTTAVGPWAIEELASLGVNLVSLANNHAADFGHQGALDTLKACEAIGLAAGGTGASLAEARAPRLLDTPEGRVALVAVSSTRAGEQAASPPGNGVPPRAGLNPLRWVKTHVVTGEMLERLREIDRALGTAASREELQRIERLPDPGPHRLDLGSPFEGALRFELGDRPGIRLEADPHDVAAILSSLEDARHRADVVILSVHSHEGVADNWYSPGPAPLIEDFCRRAVDAGADAVIGHGPHMLRGVEFYRGKPILYSLGSLIMEFESAAQRITPEMLASHGLAPDAPPSALHRGRRRGPDGEPIGFYAERRFSLGAAAAFDFRGDRVELGLIPLDLDLNRERISERGLPRLAGPAAAREVLSLLAEASADYGTVLRLDERQGVITAEGPAAPPGRAAT
jgi:poly-gamma-glutamate synthesis protein (capsule biosynthesis protein)